MTKNEIHERKHDTGHNRIRTVIEANLIREQKKIKDDDTSISGRRINKAVLMPLDVLAHVAPF